MCRSPRERREREQALSRGVALGVLDAGVRIRFRECKGGWSGELRGYG